MQGSTVTRACGGRIALQGNAVTQAWCMHHETPASPCRMNSPLHRPERRVASHTSEGQRSNTPAGAVQGGIFFSGNRLNSPALGINFPQPYSSKDTAVNIRANRKFFVSLVNNDIANQMNIAAIEFSSRTSEVSEAKFETLASRLATPPRIAQSPISFECRSLLKREGT